MESEKRQLIVDVMDGNPGAGIVIRRLMYFTMWYPLLCHLKDQGLIGSRLWQVVKDVYGHNWTNFVADQLVQMGHEGEPEGLTLGWSLPLHRN